MADRVAPYPGEVILGIDTSLGTAVAVVDADGTVRSEVSSTDPRGHAEVIGTLIAHALEHAAVGAADITHVAAGMGPGPFTGLRVGIAAARAFALGRGIPLVPVPSHEGAALGVVDASGEGDAAPSVFAVVTDARRREEAYTIFTSDPGSDLPVAIAGPTLQGAGAVIAFEASGWGGAAIDTATLRRIDVAAISAALLARVAARRIAAGWAPTEADFAPLYLRAPDVTLPHGPKRVGA